MKKQLSIKVAIAFIFLLLLLVSTGCMQETTVRSETKVKAEKDKYLEVALLFSEKCSKCHSLDVIEESSYRGERWKKVLDRMFDYDRGRFLNKSDYDIILEFLRENYR